MQRLPSAIQWEIYDFAFGSKAYWKQQFGKACYEMRGTLSFVNYIEKDQVVPNPKSVLECIKTANEDRRQAEGSIDSTNGIHVKFPIQL